MGVLSHRFDTPALVLGAGVNGLGVVRSLARAGVPVYLADPDLKAPEARTRYGRKLAIAALHGEALVTALRTLATTVFAGQQPVLILTQEETVRTVSDNRARIAPHYRFSMPPNELMDALLTKPGFHALAERHGAPVPKTVRLRHRDDLRGTDGFNFPVVLKPGSHHSGYSARFSKAYKLENRSAVERLCDDILPVHPDLVLQEWIDGEDADIYFCLQHVRTDGNPTASFVGRKIRSWPPRVGGTASCVAAEAERAEVERLTTAFFRAVGFCGMGSMELKFDRRSSRFLMVEPTVGRTDYQEEVATLNGVNIPLAAYCHESGIEMPSQNAVPAPTIWRNSLVDKWSAQLQGHGWRRGELDSGPSLDAYWRWHDPAPAWYFFRNRTLKRVARLLGTKNSP